MKTEETKAATKALNELNESCSDLCGALKGTARDIEAAKKLWRAGNKSRLIKIGAALIMFPEPTSISDWVGACFVAAGAVQKGIQNRAIFLEDVTKTFKNTLKDVRTAKNSL
ncbi:MAG TPA: hypothetical protein VI864_06195 [Candidatus Bathyarchaeia archaeon]|nr:hypothetical protein [Candidatus Bathyarchaeia archaeon]